jgi:hypothetical protein
MKIKIVELNSNMMPLKSYTAILDNGIVYTKSFFNKKQLPLAINEEKLIYIPKELPLAILKRDSNTLTQLGLKDSNTDINIIRQYVQNFKQAELEKQNTLGSTSNVFKAFEIFSFIVLVVMIVATYNMFVAFQNGTEKALQPLNNISTTNQHTINYLQKQDTMLYNTTNYTIKQNQIIIKELGYLLNYSTLHKV